MDKNNQQQYITIGIPTGQDELAIEIQSELSDIQTEINSGTNESQNSASYDSKKTWSYYKFKCIKIGISSDTPIFIEVN